VVTPALSEPSSEAGVVPAAAPSGYVHISPPATPGSLLLSRPWIVLALVALFGGLALGAGVDGGWLLLHWDEPIQRGVEARRTSLLDHLFLVISSLGSTTVVLGLGTLAAAVTWRRCRAVGTVLLIATFSRPLLEFSLKLLVDRQRPDFQRLVAGNGPSFPSGHVMAAIALWGLMPLVVSLYTRRRAIWWASVAVAGALIAGIAASRIYLGVHWFSDVTGGLVIGAIFLLGVESLLIGQHARHPCPLIGAGAPPEGADGQSTADGPSGPSPSSAMATASTAATGRWSETPENRSNPTSSGRGTLTATTSTSADTYT
jgi:undecaprenyl-diphosphatase